MPHCCCTPGWHLSIALTGRRLLRQPGVDRSLSKKRLGKWAQGGKLLFITNKGDKRAIIRKINQQRKENESSTWTHTLSRQQRKELLWFLWHEIDCVRCTTRTLSIDTGQTHTKKTGLEALLCFHTNNVWCVGDGLAGTAEKGKQRQKWRWEI